MRRRLATVLALAAATVASLHAGQAPDGAWPLIASRFAQRVQDTGIVGASLLFVKDGSARHQAVAGLQDRETRRPVDRDTIFHWASITKTFTGVAIMQLRDRGLLSLDDPVVKYVPELREVHNPFGDIA